MLVVVALGGNALLPRGARPDIEVQRHHVAGAMTAVADLCDDGHRVVLTHGNGPQVGLLALRSAAGPGTPEPFDVLGAETEGMIGYLLEQALRNARPGLEVATLLTQTIVHADDPGFRHPTKPVGPVYREAEARRLAADRGWSIAPDGGGWRRVVASPEPRAIVELVTIRRLVDVGVVVVCSGGGGIPVILHPSGGLLGADALLLLTDVAAVEEGWGRPGSRKLRELRAQSIDPAAYASGSMGPKIEACRRFVSGRPEGFAAVGALADGPGLLGGTAGTRVLAGSGPATYW
jgi:carbamate kinase